jgi:cell division septal protein FtsQ
VARTLSSLSDRRVLLLAAVVALAGACWGVYLWARDLTVFEVRHVTVRGVSGREADDIRRALRSAGERMTTLHVDQEKLEEAVDSFQAVRSVSASTDFPNSMTIEVVEWRPVAALLGRDGRRVAVAGAGTLLRGVGSQARLPVVKVEQVPASGALEEREPLRLVGVLAAAPHALTRLAERAYETDHGIEIAMRDGIVLQFGDRSRSAAKWAAAARVLADPSARGADVIDVRVPARPAARDEGQPATSAPTDASPTAPTTGAASAAVSAPALGAAGLDTAPTAQP